MDANQGYAAAIFEVARSEGALDQVEDELYRFARTVENETRLREALQDEAVPASTRAAVVAELLGKRTSPHTVSIVQFIISSGKTRQLSQIVEAFVAKAAAEKAKAVAEVRSAIPLGDDQRAKLTDALRKATGREVELKVLVDPSVLGGLLVRVGDQVFDGTIRARLKAAQEQLSGGRGPQG
ncbi:MAG: ATP synthase F1 subunit delta [Actinomycetota bacterium]